MGCWLPPQKQIPIIFHVMKLLMELFEIGLPVTVFLDRMPGVPHLMIKIMQGDKGFLLPLSFINQVEDLSHQVQLIR